MDTIRQKFVAWLKAQLGCIYVWGGQGETNITETWIRKMETSTENAERVIKFWKARINAGAKNLAAYDCSGLITVWLIANGFIKGDTNSSGLYSLCKQSIKRSDLVAGDLVFRHDGSKIYHVGVYIGSDRVIHAKGRDVGVVEETLDANGTGYWNRYGRLTNLPLDGTENTGGTGTMVGMRRKLELDSPFVKGDDVLYLQKMLNKWDKTLKLDEDGTYGPKTDAAHQSYLAVQFPDLIKVGDATYTKKV